MSRTKPTVAASEASPKSFNPRTPEDCPWHKTAWCDAATAAGVSCYDQVETPSCVAVLGALYNSCRATS